MFVGYQSGNKNTTGIRNTFQGYRSGYSNTTGGYNTFNGFYSGYKNTTGANNIYIGSYSGFNNLSGSNNVFLGRYAGYSETGSNRLYIDNSTTSTPLIYGKFDTDQLGINTNVIPTGYTLAVKGKGTMRELKVDINAGADFVFEDNYDLRSLDDLDEYLQENHHLPEIASASEMKKEGVQVGAFQIQLLQKVEELTLYTIDQEKKKRQYVLKPLLASHSKLLFQLKLYFDH